MSPNERLIQQTCQTASADLGVEITTPFPLSDAHGNEHVFIALFHKVGSEKGTLVCEAQDWLHQNETATRAGYYCSGLHPDSYTAYDRRLWIETFCEWGWFGPEWQQPPWRRGESKRRGDRRTRQ
jgi:hypothetical protein